MAYRDHTAYNIPPVRNVRTNYAQAYTFQDFKQFNRRSSFYIHVHTNRFVDIKMQIRAPSMIVYDNESQTGACFQQRVQTHRFGSFPGIKEARCKGRHETGPDHRH